MCNEEIDIWMKEKFSVIGYKKDPFSQEYLREQELERENFLLNAPLVKETINRDKITYGVCIIEEKKFTKLNVCLQRMELPLEKVPKEKIVQARIVS